MARRKEDTICALATPPGTAAIAVIRMSGGEALSICDEVFVARKKGFRASKADTHTLHYGTIREGDEIIDDVLVSVFVEPHSYTGEHAVEISCHGSPYIQQKILEILINHGARMAEAGEFTLRAFMNGKFDLSQAEAVADLIASSSKSSHDLAIDQMRGGFSEKIKGLRQRLVDFTSLIELELDFAEEDVEFADRSNLLDLLQQLQSEIRHLVSSFALGNVLKRGIPVAIVGKPNVGKSTLLNAILNEEKAIVSEIPGTTRDVIEDTIIIDSYAFRFIDTAGLRESEDRIESIGIERTYEKIRQAKVVLYVFDVNAFDCGQVRADIDEFKEKAQELSPPTLKLRRMRADESGEVEDLRQPATSNQQPATDKIFLPIANKIDQLTEAPKRFRDFVDMDCILVSAKRKENIHEIALRLVDSVKDMEIEDRTVVSNLRHYEALSKAGQAIDSVISGLAQGIPSDLVTVDIRTALHHLGEITGEITTDEVLGNIFSRFCIGK